MLLISAKHKLLTDSKCPPWARSEITQQIDDQLFQSKRNQNRKCLPCSI